jgi:hypothetical protein
MVDSVRVEIRKGRRTKAQCWHQCAELRFIDHTVTICVDLLELMNKVSEEFLVFA